MSGLDFGARAPALKAGALAPRTFADLAKSALHEQIDRIESSGHSDRGRGAAAYVCDSKADAALMTAHPAAVFPAAANRYFRLLGTPDGFVTPEMLGCPAYTPGVNQQPYIQAAIDYAKAAGLRGVYFPQPVYELWSPPRNPASGYASTDRSGNFLVIDGAAISLVGRHGNRTRLHCKGPNGGSLATDYQVVNVPTYGGDVIWRGAAVMLTGTVSSGLVRPDEQTLTHVTIRDLVFQSDAKGVRNTAWPAYPLSRDPTGLRENAWDISNKALYFQQNVHVGNVYIENVEILGFLGEAIYTAGVWGTPGLKASKVSVRNCVVKDSNGQALNPNGPSVFEVDGFYAENCSFAFEGWTGIELGKVVNAYFRKCNAGGFSGSYIYDGPLRSDGSQPSCIVDATFEDCGDIYLGSYVQGHLRLIDSSIAVVPHTATMEIKGINVDVTLMVHGGNLSQAIRFAGYPGAAQKISNNNIRLNVMRTKEAEAAGYWCTAIVNQSNSIGKSNYLYVRGHAANMGTTTSVTDNYVAIVDEGIQSFNGGFGTAFDPSSTASPDMGCGWVRATTFSGGATNYTVNLPATAMYPANAEIVVEHRDATKPSNLIEVRENGVARCLVGLKDTARFRHNRAKASWELINVTRPRNATASIDVSSTAAGAESGPYTIAASGCRPHHRVAVTVPSTGMSGFVISAVRAEADAIRFWVRNIDGAGVLDPAATVFTGRWWIDSL